MLKTKKSLNKLAITRMMNKPFSLYVHIPFCEKICDYCDFIKLQYFRKFAIPYLEALEKELESYDIGMLYTIYVGGGTPTALEDDLFEKLLKMLFPYTQQKCFVEYTVEANPESLSETKIKLMKQYGVNRVSLGVQSTDDRILEAINRHHTFKQVKEAVSLLKENGIDNINADLILGLPHASKELFKKDLENIVDLGVNHISCYSLTVHPHTVLFNKKFKPIDDDDMRELYDIAHEYLKSKGFAHYEVSNWAESNASLHNITYWRNQQYYGCGLGASGYIGDIRYKNTVNLDKYLKHEYVEEREVLTKRDKYVYEIMLALRSVHAGLTLSHIKEEYDVDLYEKWDVIEELIKEELIMYHAGEIAITYEGMMVLDQIILKLI